MCDGEYDERAVTRYRSLVRSITSVLSLAVMPTCAGESGDGSSTGTGSAGSSTGAPTSSSTGEGGDDSGSGTSAETGATEATTTTTTIPDLPADGEVVMLSNTEDSCPVSGEFTPSLPKEAGYLSGAVLTPPAYPFAVTSVSYEITVALLPECDVTLAHHVEVFVIDSLPLPAAPSTTPAFVSIDVAADLAATESRIIDLDLEVPIVLADGQSLVVAVAQAASDDLTRVVCLRVCVYQDEGTPGVNFWSRAAAEPYAWDDFVVDIGFNMNLRTVAFGKVL